MEIRLGRFAAEQERPEPVKFAWPIVLLPELFTTLHHQRMLLGYLATIGWEVYAVDLPSAAGHDSTPPLARLGLDDLVTLANEVLDELGREAIVLGHGLGGLVALALAARSSVKAAVAYAPALPNFESPLLAGVANRLNAWRGRPLQPPTKKVLFEFIGDAEPFLRESIVRELCSGTSRAPIEVERGTVTLDPAAPAPRLVVVGDSDIFAPVDRALAFANSLGARFVVVPGRGHWLVAGRALERAIAETQRFLVRALGQDLLLLYQEWVPPDDSKDT
ncbi:MAG TPA: alpha/beta fold hydrolase [Candidatus Binataceae bacterium]|nr:alpha/beta fold hydrolase [Candidatus Binataceae bacterium]